MWLASRLAVSVGGIGRMMVMGSARPGCALVRAQQYASRVRVAARDAPAKRRSLKEIIMAPAGDSAFNVGKGALAGASAIGIGALCFYGLGMSKDVGALDRAVLRQRVRRSLHTERPLQTAVAHSGIEATEISDDGSETVSGDDKGGPAQEETCGHSKTEVDARENILRASLAYINTHGFTSDAVCAGAASLGLPPTAHGLFPRGAGTELALFFYRDCNAQFAADAAVSEKKKNKGEALRNAVVARLRLTAPHAKTWPRAMALMAASPIAAMDALTCLSEFVDEAWHLAGDTSSDFSWYTKRVELAVIYKAAELFLLQDTSEDHADTWAFVDSLFSDASAAGKVLAQVDALSSGIVSSASTGFVLLRNVLGLRR